MSMPVDNTRRRTHETLGVLTRGALHQIANPLLALAGTAELALGEAEPGTRLHERLALVHRTSLEISDLVRALQAFVRLEAEPPAELSVGTAAAEAIDLVEKVVPTRGRKLSARGDTRVVAQPGELRGELVALLLDALARTDAEPIELEVADGVVRATGGGELRLGS